MLEALFIYVRSLENEKSSSAYFIQIMYLYISIIRLQELVIMPLVNSPIWRDCFSTMEENAIEEIVTLSNLTFTKIWFWFFPNFGSEQWTRSLDKLFMTHGSTNFTIFSLLHFQSVFMLSSISNTLIKYS